MDESGRARIAGFCVATTTQDQDHAQSVVDEFPGRWTAPEILNEQGIYTKEADIFSFAMIMIEVRYGRPHMLSFSLFFFSHRTGIHWCSAFQWKPICCSYVGHHGWQAPAKARLSNAHKQVVGVDPTLLGSRPWLAPGDFASFARPVGFSFSPAIGHPVTSSLTQRP